MASSSHLESTCGRLGIRVSSKSCLICTSFGPCGSLLATSSTGGEDSFLALGNTAPRFGTVLHDLAVSNNAAGAVLCAGPRPALPSPSLSLALRLVPFLPPDLWAKYSHAVYYPQSQGGGGMREDWKRGSLGWGFFYVFDTRQLASNRRWLEANNARRLH